MSKRFYLAATSIALIFFASSADFHAQQKLTLDGWRAEGSGDWRIESGEIVGTLRKNNGTADLVLDHSYEDAGVHLSFRCDQCETGVLFMDKTGDRTNATYVSLAKDDAGSTYRLHFSADSREIERKPTTAPAAQRPRIHANPEEWNHVEVFARGNNVAGLINGARFRGTAPAIDGSRRYGPIALRFLGPAGAEVRLKAISVEDLTQRSALPPTLTSDRFRRQQITDLFYSEGVAVADLNRDGSPDIIAGAFYYLGPGYRTAREIYSSDSTVWPTEPYSPGENSDIFQCYAYDFNGDGWLDVLSNRHGSNNHQEVLYINPRGENRHWDKFIAVSNNTAETTQWVDIDGDRRPELIMSTQGRVGFSTPDWSNPTKPWTFHAVSEKGLWGAHGFGYGDINGDGRLDILHGAGWWEQPARATPGVWTFHPAPFGAGTDVQAYVVTGESAERGKSPQIVTKTGGADILAYDVNADGLVDVITSLNAHGWGLAWFEQKRNEDSIEWVRHLIMGTPEETTTYGVAFSQIHALVLADIDGDGLKDVVTGKRLWAHGDDYGEDPDSHSPAVLYWFKLERGTNGQVRFVPNQIDNNSGVGTQFVATDINGDGAADVVTSGRKGLFVFLNRPH